MASAAFLAWLAQVETSRAVLCELQPAELLANWVAGGGSSLTAFRGSRIATNLAGSTAVSILAATGTVTGDVAFVIVHPNGASTTIADNNGGTPFAEDLVEATQASHTVSVFSRRIQAGDPGTFNFTLGSSQRWSAVTFTISDPDPSTIYEVVAAYNVAAATSINAPSQTTLAADAHHVAIGLADGVTVAITSTPSGYTVLENGGDEGIAGTYKKIVSPGTTGVQPFAAPAANPGMMAISFVIKAKAPAGSTTYTRQFPQFIQTGVVPGGVYRRLDGVRQNDVDLTLVGSSALVGSTAGSYFYDSATETLYIHTTTGSDPDLFAAILGFFSLFFATQPIDFVGGNLYEPRLTGVLPEVTSKADDPLFGIKAYPEGSVDLQNADAFFDKLIRAYVWKNKLATFRFGGGALAFVDYETVAVMRIEDLAPGDDVCRFRLRAMAAILERTLPLRTITASDWPNLGQGVEGTYVPLLWGSKTDIPAPLVDSTVGAQKYLVADSAAQVLTAVTAVRAIDRATGVAVTLTLATHYTVNLSACTVTVVSATYVNSAYEIRVDAQGETDGAGSYLSTFGEIAKDLLLTLGEVAGNIESSSFAAADADTPFALGLWVREPKSAAEYLSLLERSVLGAVYVANDGEWKAEIWDPTFDPATIESLADADFVEWAPDDKIERMFSEARVKYNENPASKAWKVSRATDSAVQYAYETTEAITLETALLSAADAETIAQRYRFTAGTPSIEIATELRGLAGMTYRPLQKVSVTRGRAPSASGLYDTQIMEVLEVKKRLGPPGVAVRLGDLRGFGDRVGHWTDDLAADWSAASAAERANNGFWADDDGLIDPADGTTDEKKIWW